MEDAERSHILQTLQQTEGVVGGPNGAAARLGLRRTTLISKMKRLGINHSKRSAFPVPEVASEDQTTRTLPQRAIACSSREFSKSNPHSDKEQRTR